MRILHTSDWHLGVSAEQAPREEEHELFFDWLLEEIKSRDIDVLLNTGDTFHYVQPSSKCMRIYYDFLARCARETSLKQIVVTGGNHDSPSRLDAPQAVLESLKVKVVGGLFADESTWERCLTPVYNDAGEAEVVVVAVPYVHEARLGVVTTGKKPSEIREELIERFTYLYTFLASRADELYPGVPQVATGHLTCYEDGRGHVEEDHDYHTPLHLIESLGSLPPTIFDARKRFTYVALGHIHQMMHMPSMNAWYAGTPVPTDIVESRSPRFILQVDTDMERPHAHARVTPIEVPVWRPIYEIIGSPEEALSQVEALEWSSPLSPYLYVDMKVREPIHDGMRKLDALLETKELMSRGRVVRFREILDLGEDAPTSAELQHAPLRDLTPADVFTRMYRLKYESDPPDAIMTAFRSLLVMDDADEAGA